MSLSTQISNFFRGVMAVRSANGPYRYIVRRWDDISDIELAKNIVGTDFFKVEMQMQPIPLHKFRSYLVIAPHQDDETIGAGGALLLAQQYHPKIDIVFITDGASENPEYAGSSNESSEIRNREAAKVAAELNAEIHQIGISNYKPNPGKADVEKLANLIKTLKPEVIMLPWLLDSPAKHRMANHLFWLADKLYTLPTAEIWGYQVHNDLIPNNYLDITTVIEDKIRLTRYFESQNNHFQRYDHLVKGMAIWNGRFFNNTEEKYYELFFSLPLKEYNRLISNFYFKDLKKTYRGATEIIKQMDTLNKSLGIKL